MSRIADVLTGSDFYDLEKPKERWQQVPGTIRAFAWPWLMQSGRLATQRGSKLELTQAGRQALGRPAAETLRLLWQRWMKNKLLDEFNRVEVFKGQTGKKGKRAMTSPASRRPKVESALRDCPVGSWVSVDEFWRYMRAADYGFEVSLETWRLSRRSALRHLGPGGVVNDAGPLRIVPAARIRRHAGHDRRGHYAARYGAWMATRCSPHSRAATIWRNCTTSWSSATINRYLTWSRDSSVAWNAMPWR